MAVGDSIAGLRRQLRESERELKRLTQEMERMRREMEQNRRADLDRLQREMEKTLRDRAEDMESRYQMLLGEYQRKMQGEVNAALLEQQKEYQELAVKAEEAKRQWEARSAQLQKEVDKLKNGIREKDAAAEAEAKAQLEELEQEMKTLEENPCDFFKPGRKSIVQDMLSNARQFLASGFFQAAMGLAMAAGSDARRLLLEVEEFRQEWYHTFEEWKKQVEQLESLVDREKRHAELFLEIPVEFTEEELKMHDMEKDLAYWSLGETKRTIKRLTEHRSRIEKLERSGIETALQQGQAMPIAKLRESIEEMKQIWEAWEKNTNFYQNNFRAYCDRFYTIGESMIQWMEEMELDFVSDSFEIVKKEKMDKTWVEYLESYGISAASEEEDYRRLYCMTFQTPEKDLLTISIVPVRKEEAVSNEVCYCLELGGALEGEKYINELKRIMREAVEIVVRQKEQELSSEFSEREKSVITMESKIKEEKVIVETINKIKRKEKMG